MNEAVEAIGDKHIKPKAPRKPREVKDPEENAKRKAEYEAQCLQFEAENKEHKELMKARKVQQRKAGRHQKAEDARAEWEAGAEARAELWRGNLERFEQRQQRSPCRESPGSCKSGGCRGGGCRGSR